MKKRWKTIGLFLGGMITGIVLLLALVFVMINSNKGTRPPTPPSDHAIPYPWGAIDLDEVQTNPDSDLQESIAQSFKEESVYGFDPDKDGIRTYPLLALSGGGSNGAFGAGFLCGWTEAGTRPEFKVVTGVSTGSLQAPMAFLGSDYDPLLKELFTNITTDNIYKKKSLWGALSGDSIYDTQPLLELIQRSVTPKVLADIAKRHSQGARLYIGTMNLDTKEFVIWDMGAIASSGRADAEEHFEKILLASCSIPILFPPVYFPVLDGDKTYYEMHVDGGTRSMVFFRGFLLEFDDAVNDAIREAGFKKDKMTAQLYVVGNGQAAFEKYRKNIEPRTPFIAAAVIENLFEITNTASLYRMYVLACRYNVDFNMVAIPPRQGLALDPTDFNPESMGRLFQKGFDMSSGGYEWATAPPDLDEYELFERSKRTPESTNPKATAEKKKNEATDE